MKRFLKIILHKIFSFKAYLFVFSIFKIYTLRFDKYENDFFTFVKLIPPNSCVLDIGANIGVMTILFSKKCKNADVYAFEPLPLNYQTLTKIVKFFRVKNVKTYETALGNENKTIDLILPLRDSVYDQGRVHVVNENSEEEGIIVNVTETRLDDIEELKNKKISAIKIDVENHEHYLFQGGEELIMKNKPMIFCEVWNNEKREDTFKLMQDWGYKIYFHENGKLREFDKKATSSDQFFFLNEEHNL
jgi:FkbM family methyltransferase